MPSRYEVAREGFERNLVGVREDQWAAPTPCTGWDVRALVNHVTRGNLCYAALARGGRRAEFLRDWDTEALGDDRLGAYRRSTLDCAAAFAAPGVLDATLDFPLGAASGAQALAVRAADLAIHTWDLARALGLDGTIDPGLVAWLDGNMEEVYAGLAETPVSARTSHLLFAAPSGELPAGATAQDRLLYRMGRPLNWG